MTVLKPVRKALGYVAVVLSLFFSLAGIDNSGAHAAMATVEGVTVLDTSAVLEIDSPDVSYDFIHLARLLVWLSMSVAFCLFLKSGLLTSLPVFQPFVSAFMLIRRALCLIVRQVKCLKPRLSAPGTIL